MKQIILFTRLNDETEWETWNSELQKINNHSYEITIENDEITVLDKNNNIKLMVINGKTKLGNLPPFSKNYDTPTNNLIDSKKFLKELRTFLEQKKVSNLTVVAIHFGGGITFQVRLEHWIKYLSEQNNNDDAKYLLSNFNANGKPKLTSYSIGGSYKKDSAYVQEKLQDLNFFYQELRGDSVLVDPLLEAKLELLLACSTPTGAKNYLLAVNGKENSHSFDVFLKKKLRELNNNLDSDQKYYDKTVKDVVEELSNEENYSTIDYIEKHKILRDCLLPPNKILTDNDIE